MTCDPTFKLAGSEFIEFDTGLGETIYLRMDMISAVIANLYTVYVYVGSNMTVKDPPVRLSFGTRGGAQEFALDLTKVIAGDRSMLLHTVKGALDCVKEAQIDLTSSFTQVMEKTVRIGPVCDSLEDRVKVCEMALLDDAETEAESETESEQEVVVDHVDLLHKKPSEVVEKILMIICCLLLFLLIASSKLPPR